MTSTQLKWIGVATMLIDHVGALFFPHLIVLRIIGRLTFPIFAWSLALGVERTHNWKRYLSRLVAFGFLSEIPYLLVRRVETPEFIGLNVFFTLALGLLAIVFMKKAPIKALGVLPVAVAAILAEGLHVDYGAFGVALIVLFSLTLRAPKTLALGMSTLYLLPHLFLLPELRSLSTWNGYLEHCVQLFALCALPLILSYRNEKEERPRSPLLFYILYPLQFLVLYALYVILR